VLDVFDVCVFVAPYRPGTARNLHADTVRFMARPYAAHMCSVRRCRLCPMLFTDNCYLYKIIIIVIKWYGNYDGQR
jgi:hypothetical protein